MALLTNQLNIYINRFKKTYSEAVKQFIENSAYTSTVLIVPLKFDIFDAYFEIDDAKLKYTL